MAKGRFLSRTLPDSKRFANLSERAALLYYMALPNTDVEGRFEADPLSLLGFAGRFARMHGWTEADVEKARDELAESGLWKLYGDQPNVCVEVDKFSQHNKLRKDRETPSVLPQPPWVSAGVLPRNAGGLPEYSREMREASRGDGSVRGSTPTQVQVQEQVQEQVEAEAEGQGRGSAPANGSGSRGLTSNESRANRLIHAWRGAHERISRKFPDDPILPTGASAYEAQEIAKALGETIDLFPDGDLMEDGTLAHEVARLIAVFEEKHWPRRFGGVCKMLGAVFDDLPEIGRPVIFKGAK